MRGGPGTDDPGRISWPGVTVLDLILQAYDVTVDQVSGLAWLNSAGTPIYDLDATIPPGTTKEQFRLMLQNLLADRFHLKLHHETQSRPGYELSVAAGGPKLKDWTPAPGSAPGLTMGVNQDRGTLRTTFRGSMADICRQLGAPINLAVDARSPRPHVADKTGLSGMYEFVLEYATTLPPPGAPNAAPPPAAAPVPTASDPGGDARGFFAAFERLGLKLTKVKDVPVDILVVDAADKVPTAN
jgi:uncharacterized protein (TIGR03435 family)